MANPDHENWMMMSGLIALCVLLAVAVVVMPLFGPRVAAVTAVALVTAISVVCYLLCVPRQSRALTEPSRGGR